jgi:peptidoglycan/LPS O-acetylase OafA/YrhL
MPGVGERFVAGDPLRAVSALAVLTYHVALMVSGYQRFRGHPGSFEEHYGEVPGAILIVLGLPAVYVFLVLSGYLIGRPFTSAFVLGSDRPAAGPFVRNRLLRIVPMFAVIWTVTWLIHLDLVGGVRDVVEPYLFLQVYHPTAVSHQIVHGWSVDIEMVFYIVLPIAVAAATLVGSRLGPWGRAWLLIIPLVVIAAVSLRLRVGTSDEPSFFQPQTLAFTVVPGLILATLEPLVAPRLRARGEARWALRVLTAILVAGAVLTPVVGYFDPWFHTAAIMLAGGLVAVPLVRQWAGLATPRILDHPALHRLGVWSYSLYLIHVLVRDAFDSVPKHVESVWLGFVLVELAVLATAIPLSALTYRYIELPFLNLKRAGERAGGPSSEIPGPGTPAAAAQAGSMAP